MATTTTTTTVSNKKRIHCVVVIRHGERLDYVERDAGRNWVRDNVDHRPWDPPLTERGLQQALEVGEALRTTILQELGLPPIGAVYSSPFLRCRQTAVGILRGYCCFPSDDVPSEAALKVKVELGLSESINQNWYRSWALPGADGSWGYKNAEQPTPDPQDLHPMSREIVHKHILDWRQSPDDKVDRFGILTQETLDHDHQSQTHMGGDYSYDPPKFESYIAQRGRMFSAMNVLSEQHLNETIVLVSHGGPVTHLYESVTGNNWNEHGESRYCCLSVYVKEAQQNEGDDKDESTSSGIQWTPLVVNHCVWDGCSANVSKESPVRNTSFQWS